MPKFKLPSHSCSAIITRSQSHVTTGCQTSSCTQTSNGSLTDQGTYQAPSPTNSDTSSESPQLSTPSDTPHPSVTSPLSPEHSQINNMDEEGHDSGQTSSAPDRENQGDEEMARILGALLSGRSRIDQLMKKVGHCNGADPDKTLKWLRAVNTTNCPLDLAKATAEGPLADHIKRCKGDWPLVRREIADNFISAAFEQHQRDVLRAFTQRPGEPITTYNYEFNALVKEGYPTLPEDQSDLVRLYLSNLANRGMAENLVQNDTINTLEDAMRLAQQKAKAGERLMPRSAPKGRTAEVSTLPSPELTAVTKALEAVAALANDIAKDQQEMKGQVAALTESSRKPAPRERAAQQPPAQRHRPTRNDKCHRCGKYGHFAADCRQPLPQKQGHPQQPSSLTKCERCRRTDHQTRNCRAGPPSRPCYCGGLHWTYDCPENRPGAIQAPATQNQGN